MTNNKQLVDAITEVVKAGTSEGAKLGWEKRKRGLAPDKGSGGGGGSRNVNDYYDSDANIRKPTAADKVLKRPVLAGSFDWKNAPKQYARVKEHLAALEAKGVDVKKARAALQAIGNELKQMPRANKYRVSAGNFKPQLLESDLHAVLDHLHTPSLHMLTRKSASPATDEVNSPVQTALLHAKSHFDDYVPNITQMMTQWRLQLDNSDFDWDGLVHDTAGFVAATFGLPESVALDATNEMIAYLNHFALTPLPISTAVANQVFSHLKLIIGNRQHMQGSSSEVSGALTQTVL